MIRQALVIALPVAALAVGTSGWPSRLAATGEEGAVRRTVQLYFEGLMHADTALLGRAFHPAAALETSPGRGRPTRVAYAEWVRGLSGAPTGCDGHRSRIVAVDITGNAAVVKADLRSPTTRYVDYLSLLKVDGEWRIVNRIWHEAPIRAE